jgi:diguanylate cyclase (GGDEF)-like protein
MDEAEASWSLILQDFHGILIVLRADGTIRYSQPPLPPSTSQDSATLAEIVHPDDADVVLEALSRLRNSDAETVTFLMRLRQQADWHLYEATARNLLDEPLVQAIVVNGEDITRRTQLEESLAQLASRDELTGLVNRAAFLDHVELALARSGASTETGVFFVDIDDFRGLVERAGTEVGDQLLVRVAEGMRSRVREGAIAARLGGDEFALLCENVAGSAEAAKIAKRLADLLSKPVTAGEEDISVAVSIGVGLASSGRVQAATLVRHAEVAMYRARRGRARYEIFRGRRRSTQGSPSTPA